MKLFGSQTSPFVRRVRILCNLYSIKYEFIKVDYSKEEDSKLISQMSKVKRIPLIVTESGDTIFDSTIIAEYILGLQGMAISLKERLNLKLIDEANDSLVILFQLIKYDTDKNWTSRFAQGHINRVKQVFEELDSNIVNSIKENSLAEIWLFCMLDWNKFRAVFDDSKLANLNAFHSRVTLKSRVLISDSMPSI